jgi:hypothetical protein
VYGRDTDLIFPLRTLPRLRPLRGPEWQELVDRVQAAPGDSPEALAFSLVMVRLAGCMTCTVDSYRALRGCTLCAEQAARRFHGPDAELQTMFEEACVEITAHLDRGGADGLLQHRQEAEVLNG